MWAASAYPPGVPRPEVRAIANVVGGSSALRGMGEAVAEYTNIPTCVPPNPFFVTPLGIAMHDALQ